MAFDPRLRSPKEEPLFVLGVVFSIIVWMVVVITIVGLIYGLFILAFVLIAHALHLAHVQGNGLKISERQLPDLYQRVKSAGEKLGLPEVPDVYVLQSGGILNAFATKLLSRRYIIIYSELAERCEDPRQLDFVVGHELGHHAAGHLRWKFFLLPFRLVPWLGPAYSRACEYTCDRAGFAAVGELEPAIRGLCVLAAGRLATRADLQAFADQRDASGGFWMSIFELVSTHPYLCKRAAALQEFAAPGTVRAVPRTPLAYPLAPFLGFATAGGAPQGGLIMVIAIMAFALAVAVPALHKFQDRLAAAGVNQYLQTAPTDLRGAQDDSDELDATDRPTGPARGPRQVPPAPEKVKPPTSAADDTR